LPRFIATMDSSDFCAAFAPQTSQVHNATFQTRRPSMPRHAFRAANRLRRFFSASRILRRWPHGSLGVTRLNGKGSLTLRLTCLSDRASTVGSPLPPPVFLTDCRFLVSTNSFHFVSSIALLGAPKFPLCKGTISDPSLYFEVVEPVSAFATDDASIERVGQVVIDISELVVSALNDNLFHSLTGLGNLDFEIIAFTFV